MGQKIRRQGQSIDTVVPTEEDTGRIWIDGRTIYRKVVRGNFNISAGTFSVSHGISGLTTSMEILSIGGGWKIGSATVAGGQMQMFNQYRESGGNWITLTAIDQTSFSFYSSFAWGSSWITAIIEYVK